MKDTKVLTKDAKLAEVEKLKYIYQHFQDHEKIYESDPQITTEPIHDTYTLR